jgi:flagellar hook-length control protein FliK
MVQISALGPVNTPIIGNSDVQNVENKGFTKVFSGLMGAMNTESQSNKEVVDETTLSKEELADLLSFLQTSDLTELEEGLSMMDQILLNANVDIAEVIKEQLDITDEELIASIMSLLSQIINMDDAGLNNDPLKDLIDKLPSMDGNQAIMSLISVVPFISPSDANIQMNEEFATLTKVLKLFQLLSNFEKTNDNNQALNDFLQKVSTKVEATIQEKQPGRIEFLQKVFTPIVKELNLQNIKNFEANLQTTQPVDGIQNNQLNSLSNSGFQFQQMSNPEQLTVMLDQSGKPVSTDQIIQQFEKILARSQLTQAGGTQKLLIKLNPGHLGELKVELIQKDSTILAKIVTSNSIAKEMLESQIHNLKQAFGSQNIQVERIEIIQQSSSEEGFLNKDSQEKQEQKEQRDKQNDKQEQQKFSVSFEEFLLNMEV